MSSKLLQTPQIIEILGSTIRVRHPDLSNQIPTYLSAPQAAGTTAMTVRDNNNFANADYGIIGAIGDNQTEEFKVNGAVTAGTALTIANTTVFAHELDAPVTKIRERGMKIYGSATDGGTGTLITSVDAISTPIADTVNIQWGKPFTEYTLLSTDTAYTYYYVVFTDGTTDSSKSAYVAATGYGATTVANIIEKSLDTADQQIDNYKFTWDMLVRWVQDWQDAVTQFAYQDPTSGKLTRKDWNFEFVTSNDYTEILVVQNEDQYDMSQFDLKYQDSARAIVDLRIGSSQPLKYIETSEFDTLFEDQYRTTTSGALAVGDTTINVVSTAGFSTSGSLNIRDQIVTYTGKTTTTFTGVPASGTGSITAIVASGAAVWHGNSQGVPKKFTITNNVLKFDVPPDATTAGKSLNMKFYIKIPRITKASDTTLIPFINTATPYITYKIEERKKNYDVADRYKVQFRDMMIENAQNDNVPMPQSYQVFEYADFSDQMVENEVYITH